MTGPVPIRSAGSGSGTIWAFFHWSRSVILNMDPSPILFIFLFRAQFLAKNITEGVTEFIALDNQRTSMVEDWGFLRHLEFLNPWNALWPRHNISLTPLSSYNVPDRDIPTRYQCYQWTLSWWDKTFNIFLYHCTVFNWAGAQIFNCIFWHMGGNHRVLPRRWNNGTPLLYCLLSATILIFSVSRFIEGEGDEHPSIPRLKNRL